VTLAFRNVEVAPASPVEAWPAEAIETVMDRGALPDWRRLAGVIRRHPWGEVARSVEAVAGWGEHYGVDALMLAVIRRARDDVERAGRAAYAEQIRGWRAGTGMSLREFARAAGTSASRLCAYENAGVAPTTDVLGRLRHVALGARGERVGDPATGAARAAPYAGTASRAAGFSTGTPTVLPHSLQEPS
jgi:DNA-binding transcriptional regulator YiaG